MNSKMKLKMIAGFSLSSLIAPPAVGQELYDVVFLSDTTGSMGGLISSAQNSSNAIVESFLTRGNVFFGVGEYKDGNSDAFGFRYNLTGGDPVGPIFSNDAGEVGTAIGGWGASGGGDFPEDSLFGLREVASTAPWREGSSRIIFWFGDATSLDPGSDGTTMSTTLAALNDECVQVIAVDLSRLDDLGQATEIVNTTLDCGVRGGLVEDVSALSDLELEEQIDDILLRLFDEIVTESTPALLDSSARLVGVTMARTMSRDVGGRLARLRAGGPGDLSVTQAPATFTSDAKCGLAQEIPGTISFGDRWHVWGEAYAFNEKFDAQRDRLGRLISPEIDFDIYGGTVGVDYRIDSNWTAGVGFGAASGEAELGGGGDLDVDSFAIMPYVSFCKKNALAGADLYADLMYAYTDSEYDFSPGNIDADGESHQFELNVGLNYTSVGLMHGPFAQIRSLSGEIDGGSDFDSLATQLGYQVSKAISVGGGTIVPNASVAWEHEFEDNQGSVAGVPLGGLDEDLFVGTLGVQYLLSSGVHLGANYQARLGDEAESHYFGLNAGFQF